MSDMVVDSSVVAKWILPEPDSAKAELLITRPSSPGDRLIALDPVFPEVANAIWKQQRWQLISSLEAANFLEKLRRVPLRVEPALALLTAGLEIAVKYDRARYDALSVALARSRAVRGVTADEPLFNVVRHDFPEIVLLRDM